MRPPLSGIRVLDFTQFLSGPYCTQILADLGAEIIKLEPPAGDLSRHIPPHFVEADSVYYLASNRGKQSVVIDLKSPDGLQLVRELIARCDVVVENFRPGVLERLGISGAAMRSERPGLIWCAISGFGQDGPYRDKPAYDMVVQALSGGMSLTGEPGRGAVRAGIPIADICAGMYAAIGINAALARKAETGEGATLDISMLDCQVAMLSYQGAYHLHSGHVPDRQGANHDSIPTYRTFLAGDGREVVVTANTERMWRNLAQVLGLAALIDDPRFLDNAARFANREALWERIGAAFRTRPADEWIVLLEKAEVPVAAVNTLDRVLNDPQVRQRGMVMDLGAGERAASVTGNPILFAGEGRVEGRYPPALGEDTTNVLAGLLGLDAARIADLAAVGAIGAAPAGRTQS